MFKDVEITRKLNDRQSALLDKIKAATDVDAAIAAFNKTLVDIKNSKDRAKMALVLIEVWAQVSDPRLFDAAIGVTGVNTKGVATEERVLTSEMLLEAKKIVLEHKGITAAQIKAFYDQLTEDQKKEFVNDVSVAGRSQEHYKFVINEFGFDVTERFLDGQLEGFIDGLEVESIKYFITKLNTKYSTARNKAEKKNELFDALFVALASKDINAAIAQINDMALVAKSKRSKGIVSAGIDAAITMAFSEDDLNKRNNMISALADAAKENQEIKSSLEDLIKGVDLDNLIKETADKLVDWISPEAFFSAKMGIESPMYKAVFNKCIAKGVALKELVQYGNVAEYIIKNYETIKLSSLDKLVETMGVEDIKHFIDQLNAQNAMVDNEKKKISLFNTLFSTLASKDINAAIAKINDISNVAKPEIVNSVVHYAISTALLEENVDKRNNMITALADAAKDNGIIKIELVSLIKGENLSNLTKATADKLVDAISPIVLLTAKMDSKSPMYKAVFDKCIAKGVALEELIKYGGVQEYIIANYKTIQFSSLDKLIETMGVEDIKHFIDQLNAPNAVVDNEKKKIALFNTLFSTLASKDINAAIAKINEMSALTQTARSKAIVTNAIDSVIERAISEKDKAGLNHMMSALADAAKDNALIKDRLSALIKGVLLDDLDKNTANKLVAVIAADVLLTADMGRKTKMYKAVFNKCIADGVALKELVQYGGVQEYIIANYKEIDMSSIASLIGQMDVKDINNFIAQLQTQDLAVQDLEKKNILFDALFTELASKDIVKAVDIMIEMESDAQSDRAKEIYSNARNSVISRALNEVNVDKRNKMIYVLAGANNQGIKSSLAVLIKDVDLNNLTKETAEMLLGKSEISNIQPKLLLTAKMDSKSPMYKAVFDKCTTKLIDLKRLADYDVDAAEYIVANYKTIKPAQIANLYPSFTDAQKKRLHDQLDFVRLTEVLKELVSTPAGDLDLKEMLQAVHNRDISIFSNFDKAILYNSLFARAAQAKNGTYINAIVEHVLLDSTGLKQGQIDSIVGQIFYTINDFNQVGKMISEDNLLKYVEKLCVNKKDLLAGQIANAVINRKAGVEALKNYREDLEDYKQSPKKAIIDHSTGEVRLEDKPVPQFPSIDDKAFFANAFQSVISNPNVLKDLIHDHMGDSNELHKGFKDALADMMQQDVRVIKAINDIQNSEYMKSVDNEYNPTQNIAQFLIDIDVFQDGDKFKLLKENLSEKSEVAKALFMACAIKPELQEKMAAFKFGGNPAMDVVDIMLAHHILGGAIGRDEEAVVSLIVKNLSDEQRAQLYKGMNVIQLENLFGVVRGSSADFKDFDITPLLNEALVKKGSFKAMGDIYTHHTAILDTKHTEQLVSHMLDNIDKLGYKNVMDTVGANLVGLDINIWKQGIDKMLTAGDIERVRSEMLKIFDSGTKTPDEKAQYYVYFAEQMVAKAAAKINADDVIGVGLNIVDYSSAAQQIVYMLRLTAEKSDIGLLRDVMLHASFQDLSVKLKEALVNAILQKDPEFFIDGIATEAQLEAAYKLIAIEEGAYKDYNRSLVSHLIIDRFTKGKLGSHIVALLDALGVDDDLIRKDVLQNPAVIKTVLIAERNSEAIIKLVESIGFQAVLDVYTTAQGDGKTKMREHMVASIVASQNSLGTMVNFLENSEIASYVAFECLQEGNEELSTLLYESATPEGAANLCVGLLQYTLLEKEAVIQEFLDNVDQDNKEVAIKALAPKLEDVTDVALLVGGDRLQLMEWIVNELCKEGITGERKDKLEMYYDNVVKVPNVHGNSVKTLSSAIHVCENKELLEAIFKRATPEKDLDNDKVVYVENMLALDIKSLVAIQNAYNNVHKDDGKEKGFLSVVWDFVSGLFNSLSKDIVDKGVQDFVNLLQDAELFKGVEVQNVLNPNAQKVEFKPVAEKTFDNKALSHVEKLARSGKKTNVERVEDQAVVQDNQGHTR